MNTKAMILAAIVMLAPLAAAQYASSGSSSRMGGALASRGSVSGDKFLLNSGVELTELKGVWAATGRQTPLSAEMAGENNTMPDCSQDNSTFTSYKGLDYGSGQFYILAGTGSVNSIIANQQRSVFSPNVTYNSSLIVTIRNGAPVCTHFRPYVELTTGELRAESLSMTQWTVNATSGNPTRTSLNCELTGNEMPGCYTGSVATAPAAATPTVSVSSIGAPAPRPSGAIRTVTRNTWTCQQGECLRLNPKYSFTTPAYGG